MSYIIRYSEETFVAPIYVERLNGFMPPTYTANIKRARPFDTLNEAQIYVDKFKAAAVREGSDSVTIEAVEYEPAAPTEEPLPTKLEWYGPPRGRFAFGKNCRVDLYMKKNDEGNIIYAYSDDPTASVVTKASTDYNELIKAMCVAAMRKACAVIDAWERRHTNG